jgi:hypothetical protein
MSVDVNTTDPNLQLPDKSLLYEIAGASYADNYNGLVDGWSLLKQTATLKFFKKDDYPVIVVGVRGTADFQDFQAWLPVVLDKIVDTQRYKQDTAVLTQFQQDYIPTQYYYYATGHSLAGAIIDDWLHAGLILKARTYNPAIQLKDVDNTSLDNYRVYASGDPLYKLFGSRALKKGTKGEVRQSSTFIDVRTPFALSPSLLWGKELLNEHTWRNPLFHGGKV